MLKEKIFDISSIHKTYWKDFCDVCYSRFGFESGEERTYEQKYETFCRCKPYITENDNYELQLMSVKEADLKRLHTLYDWFFNVTDGIDIVPSLYCLVRMMRTIGRNLNRDVALVKYICPRKTKVNYSEYFLKEKAIVLSTIENNKTLREIVKSGIESQMLEELWGWQCFGEYTLDYVQSIEHEDGTVDQFNNADITIDWAANSISHDEVCLFNASLREFIDALPQGTECPRGNELQAFLYRLFMSYEDSLPDIKEELEELPSPRNLMELGEELERLKRSFFETSLGERWKTCMEYDDGLKHFANYFMHHRKDFSVEEEHTFLYTLDKISIVIDILNGKAEKYWLDVKYPEEWQKELVADNVATDCKVETNKSTLMNIEDDICHLIHPAVLDEYEQIKIHKEIKNLVKDKPVRDICLYLRTLEKAGKILLPKESKLAIAELQRMGMPNENTKGFTYNNFNKYYMPSSNSGTSNSSL